ncbi:unnamed protein product [Leptidea sinapis]|uniref:Uncharacterized protein n=1 Tax=Leptidea sinapis TaxID=189913 RepID=A0A5E4PUV9_9NEOP|nr:unnamed protein product [Leptidea sinapis]
MFLNANKNAIITDDGTKYEVITTKIPDRLGHPIINVKMIPVETFDDPLDDSPSEVNEANISVGGITGKTKLKASNNFVKANAQSATQAKEQKVPNQYKRYTNINTGESSGYSSCDRLL